MNLRTHRASDQAVSATFPPSARDMTRELMLFAGAFAAYNVVRGLAQGGSGLAIAHGRALVRLERSCHLLFEPHSRATLYVITGSSPQPTGCTCTATPARPGRPGTRRQHGRRQQRSPERGKPGP